MEESAFIDSLPDSVAVLAAAGSSGYLYIVGLAIAMAALLFCSALTSASEVAFFSIKPGDLEAFASSGESDKERVALLMENPRRLLANILILNNLFNVSAITLSTFIMWDLAGTRSPHELIVGVVTFGITFMVTLFGEIVPKVYVKQHNVSYARWASGVWKALQPILYPISRPLLSMSGVVESRFKRKGYSLTVKEIKDAVEFTASNDATSKNERDILQGIVNFGTLTVKQIMTPRTDIFSAPDDLPLRKLVEQLKGSGFSRIPIHHDTLDKVRGVLYIKDLLPHLEAHDDFEWQQMIRPGFFVPETKKLDSLLKDFQARKIHIAMVVDEYGGTAGLVTLEDLIEEIIGEINDEFDEERSSFVRVNENTFVFEGKTLLNDFCRAIHIDPSELDPVRGESESLGGLLLELNQGMPKATEQIVFDRFLFTVMSADPKKINHVRVVVSEPPEPTEP